jgi:hypothetical protein
MPFIVDCASANDKLAPYINEVRRPGSQSPARLRPADSQTQIAAGPSPKLPLDSHSRPASDVAAGSGHQASGRGH